jgi:hypothetical protein
VRWLLVVIVSTAFMTRPTAADCASDAAALLKAQANLPRLEVASPFDRPPFCITLETIMAFAGRVKAHVTQCPASQYAQSVPGGTKRASITPSCSASTAAGARCRVANGAFRKP